MRISRLALVILLAAFGIAGCAAPSPPSDEVPDVLNVSHPRAGVAEYRLPAEHIPHALIAVDARTVWFEETWEPDSRGYEEYSGTSTPHFDVLHTDGSITRFDGNCNAQNYARSSDGSIWFTQRGQSNPASGFLGGPADCRAVKNTDSTELSQIAPGTQGAMWYAEFQPKNGDNGLVRITTHGIQRHYERASDLTELRPSLRTTMVTYGSLNSRPMLE